MQLQPWVERIKSETSGIRQIEEAVDIQSVLAEKPKNTSVWVVPVSTRPGNNLVEQGVLQTVTGTVGILIGIRNLRGSSGQGAQGELATTQQKIESALLGWDGGALDFSTLCIHAGGRHVGYTDRTLWWLEQYRTSWSIRANPQ